MSAFYPFAAVLFDLDGVIIDTTELHYRVWDEFGRQQGYVPTRADLLATNGRRAGETIRAWLGQQIDDATVEAMTREREQRCFELLRSEAVPAVPGAVEFVKALAAAGIPRAVATSAIPANAALSLERVGLLHAFGTVITAADVQRGKPDPEPYLKAAAALGVPASRCVVIEDSVSGLRAGKAAGARCVALATTFPREQLAVERPDWLVEDFRDFPEELKIH